MAPLGPANTDALLVTVWDTASMFFQDGADHGLVRLQDAVSRRVHGGEHRLRRMVVATKTHAAPT